MDNYLVQHALENVCCSLDQDSQFLFKPARISTPRGVRHYIKVEWDKIELPDQNSYYHIYQIGQLNQNIINLIPDEKEWYSASDVINDRNIIIDIYTAKGLNLPRFEVFFRVTKTRNLIVAVKEQLLIDNLRVEPVFVRFYSNAYFNSTRSNDEANRTSTKGIRVNISTDIVNFQNEVHDLKTNYGGEVYVFHNGWLVSSVIVSSIAIGDKLEYVQDTSIYEVLDIPVSDLRTFTSTLDGSSKYIIRRLKGSTDSIGYRDDIDIFLYKEGFSSFNGTFYHKSNKQSLRMLTHKDLSIPVQNLVNIVNAIEDWDDVQSLVIRLHIRKSGYSRPLIHENSRIKELYKLGDDEILRAMVGANSNVSEWQAANLEKSMYPAIMSGTYNSITQEVVEEAYGYNAISTLIGDTPQKPINIGGGKGVHLPYALQSNSTIFEYSFDGRLLTYKNHTGLDYFTYLAMTGYFEGMCGMGGDYLPTTYGLMEVTIPDGYSYKAYICPKVGGVVTNEWRVAEEDVEYMVEDNVLLWMIDPGNFYTAVRDDSKFIVKTLHLLPIAGLISFDITAIENTDGIVEERTPSIPTGKIDVFLDKHPLIENLDYIVKWPSVYIINKEFYDPDHIDQEVTYRVSGFCTSDIKLEAVSEYGFVEHKLLSRNRRFDIRDDKVMRFIADGRLWSKEELDFSELDSGVRIENVRNGAPYVIEDIVVPIGGVSGKETYQFRADSRELDKRISDYLTLYYPEPVIEDVSLIPYRHRLYSPFISRILHDLVDGSLAPTEILGQYGDSKILTILESYEYLLEFDPIMNGVDDKYIIIHPHNGFTVIELDIYQYNFINRVISVYLDNKIDTATHIAIKDSIL